MNAKETNPDLQKRHPMYNQMKEEWDLLIACYEGTKSMLDYGVLERNERESPENFQQRLKEAYSFEYTPAIVDLLSHYLHKEPVNRDMGGLAKDSLFEAFQSDSDLYGTDWDQLIKTADKYASVYGHVGLLVDKPQAKATTKAEEKAGGLYPYVSVYHPQAILNWEFARDDNHRPYLAHLMLVDEDGLYRLWWPDRWEVWKDGDGKNAKAERIAEGDNPLKEIPFVWLFADKTRHRGIGASDVSGIARIDASIMRNLSHAEEVIKYAAFPMMRKPMRQAGSAEEDESGVTAILEFNPKDGADGKPDWLEAKVLEPVNAILSWIERKTTEAFRSGNVGGVAATEVRNQARSGVALQSEFQQLSAKLGDRAKNCEEAELRVLYFWQKWQKTEHDVSAEWPTKFSVADLATDLENSLVAKTIVESKLFQQMLAKRVARLVLTNVPDSEWAEVDKEIEKGAVKALAVLPEGDGGEE